MTEVLVHEMPPDIPPASPFEVAVAEQALVASSDNAGNNSTTAHIPKVTQVCLLIKTSFGHYNWNKVAKYKSRLKMKEVKLTFQVSLEATAVASAEPPVVLERELERIPPDSGISSEENLSQQIRQQALDAPQVNADSSLEASGVKNNNNETVINQQDDQSGGMEIAGATAKFIKVWPLTLFISNLGHPFVIVFIYYRQKVTVCYGEKVSRTNR